MWEMRNAYNILFGKREGKRQLGRSGLRWKGNIEMHLWEIMWEGVDWIYLAQDGDHF
jgi:hypothetical protein